MSYDVAVVKTAQPLPIKEFVALPPAGYNLVTSSKVDAVGWGNTEEGMLSKELRTVRIPVISAAKCKRAWGQYYSDVVLCAGRISKDSCSGDSGKLFFLSIFINPNATLCNFRRIFKDINLENISVHILLEPANKCQILHSYV